MEVIENNDLRPISVLRQNPGSFYVVRNNHPNYVSQNGCLYSKDYKKIQYVPRGLYGTFVIPEGTEVIDICCFEKTNFDQIIIPSSLKIVENGAFRGSEIESLDLKNVETMGFCAVWYCEYLQIFKGTKLKTLNFNELMFCKSLKKIIIGMQTEKIGYTSNDYNITMEGDNVVMVRK